MFLRRTDDTRFFLPLDEDLYGDCIAGYWCNMTPEMHKFLMSNGVKHSPMLDDFAGSVNNIELIKYLIDNGFTDPFNIDRICLCEAGATKTLDWLRKEYNVVLEYQEISACMDNIKIMDWAIDNGYLDRETAYAQYKKEEEYINDHINNLREYDDDD